ncbi:MAG: DUF2252 domain-containing protein [Chthoniobacterales bacterium]
MDKPASPAVVRQRSREQLYTDGKAIRDSCPRASHADWKPPADRPDPIEILEASNKGRLPELIPLRYGRMIPSPFVFFRGAAAIMAADLAHTPATGIRVQVCGDAHLMNFGVFATPERRVIFDINDFDETLPAPWEWDVKRLATSFLIASLSNGFSESAARKTALCCVRSYRERMAEFAQMRTLEVWYARLDLETILPSIKDQEAQKRLQRREQKAEASDVLETDFPKLVSVGNGEPTIRDNPPLIYHVREKDGPEFEARVADAFARYRESLPDERRVLLDRFQRKDFAMKVVGVGSVGTFCAVMLMMADVDDPLFLQIKEAGTSVLEPYAGKSVYANHGQRVVTGLRLMQSASDLFLGWAEGRKGRHFYVRQLHDMKIKLLVELFTLKVMVQYAEYCGWALARAHARAGQPALIAGYLGKGDQFDEAVADFATAYAQQNERDYKALVQAARQGRIEVYTES